MKAQLKHAFTFSLLSLAFLYFLHHLPINHIFIDPFSEAIKSQDVMDISISKFRDHNKVKLDDRIVVINSKITDREKISLTLDRLLEDNPASIGIDLLFDSISYSRKDSLLAKSLNDNRVVLGYTYKENENPKEELTEFSIKENSQPFFTQNCSSAYVNLGTQDGFSIRTFVPKITDSKSAYNSFALELASKRDAKILNDLNTRNNKIEWINFRRKQPGAINMRYPINKDKFIHYQQIDIDNFLATQDRFPQNYFKDKIVLIGFVGEDKNSLSMRDRYYTPLNEQSGRSMPDMHGVVVHANIISMLLDRDFIDDIPEKILYLISFLVFFVNYFLFRKIIQKKILLSFWAVRIVQILEFIFFFGLCLILMSNYNIRMGFILIITSVIMSFELYEFYDHKVEKILKKRLPKLFN